MRSNNLAEAARWLAQAKHDLDVARWNAEGRFWSDACFMARQAGGKALKAFLYAQGERRILRHALLELVRKCAQHHPGFESLEPFCRRLDKYYIITRYPNGLPGLVPADYFDEEEARQALAESEAILQTCESKITSQDSGEQAGSSEGGPSTTKAS